MNFYDDMKKYGSYIDSGIKTLSECVRMKNFRLIISNEDEKLIKDMNDSVNSMKDEITNLYSQAMQLDNLNDLLTKTANDIQTLKKVGNMLGVPLKSSIQTEYLAQADKTFDELERQGDDAYPDTKSEIDQFPTSIPYKMSKNNVTTEKPTFREIIDDEYQTLPPIVPLLIRIDDMNKHYRNLIESLNSDTFLISADDFIDIIQLSSSRMNAFIRALVTLNRMVIIEDQNGTKYKML